MSITKFSFGGCDKNLNKTKWITASLQRNTWKIQYNEFGFEDEAEAIRKDLSSFTGISKTKFPKTIGLSRRNQLKIWFWDKLVWDYGQEQKFPTAQELVFRSDVVEQNSWTIHKKK